MCKTLFPPHIPVFCFWFLFSFPKIKWIHNWNGRWPAIHCSWKFSTVTCSWRRLCCLGESWLWCNFLSSIHGGGKRKKSSFVSLWNLFSLYPVASIDPSACSTGLNLQVQVHPSSLKLVFPCLLPGWVRWLPCFHYLNTHCTCGIVLLPQQK